MKFNEMSLDVVKGLFRYEPETGDLIYLSGPRKGRSCCHGNRRYFEVYISGRFFKVHRVVWALAHGRWPTAEIDHINGIKTDNRLANLREATRAENLANKGPLRRRGPESAKGVYRHRSGWQATIRKDGVKYTLGTFNTQAEANAAYIGASKVLYGEFAWPNEAAARASSEKGGAR